MSQRHPLLTQWGELGESLAYALPLQTFERLIAALKAAQKAAVPDVVEAIDALFLIASGQRSDLTLCELLALCEHRIREAREQARQLMRHVRV